MKKIIYKTKICLGIAAVVSMTMYSCTSGFEGFNTDPNSAQSIDMSSLITSMQLDAVYPTTGETTTPVNRYQTGWNLLADHYAGYMACANHFDGGNNPMVYNLTSNTWSNTVFSVAFTQVMPAWLQLKYAHDKGLLPDHVMAVANIIKVLTIHRASDMYGPLPVLHFGEARNPYDSQEAIYKHCFEILNTSIDALKEFTSSSPNEKPLVKVDAIYAGDYNKWLKLANSIKLRLAMRIYYVEPILSAQYAGEALLGGVITNTEDNAVLKTYNQFTINNPLEMIWNSYDDARMSASMDSYLNGFEDPRREKMFQAAKIAGGGFHGVRNGLESTAQSFYTKMSAPNISTNTPMPWLKASEVAFLNAEYLLTQSRPDEAGLAYNEGIRLSFIENGLAASAAATYSSDDTKKPAYFSDKSDNAKNIGALSRTSIKWVSTDSKDICLERIITQKWIALYPDGMEAWAEFRRTGNPKLFRIVANSADPSINVNTQIRRMVFPKIEYANNAGAVNAAARLLSSGTDKGGSKLWWDKK